MSVSAQDSLVRRIEKVSIIVPMYNEAEHIEHLVEDIAAQDFQGELEVIVADGASTDESVARLNSAAARLGVPLEVVPNPRRWVSAGLNACIARCTGDLIVRLDCHSHYPTDYLRCSTRAAEETGALAVGGIAIPVGVTPAQRAIACALDGPFGGAHWTRHGTSDGRVAVDNFYCGAFRPEAFASAGLFDESLVRNQDDELNFRIRSAGGQIVLDPEIRASYLPRATLRRAFRQYYEYGVWKIPVMLKHRSVFSARSLAPVALVTSLAVLTAGTWVLPAARWLLAAELGAYAAASVAFGAAAIRRRGEPLELLPRVAATYPALHFGYGIGMLQAIADAITVGARAHSFGLKRFRSARRNPVRD